MLLNSSLLFKIQSLGFISMGLFSYKKVEGGQPARKSVTSPTTTEYTPHSHNSHRQPKKWDTNAFRRFPKFSLLAFFFLCVVISFASYVIISANETPVLEWNLGLTPAVWLALCTVAVNGCVQSLLDKGVELYWWVAAASGGSTPEELHNAWVSGTLVGSLMLLFTKLKISRLATAAIFAAAIRINGPLFQQVISTKNIEQIDRVEIVAEMFEELPRAWSGILGQRNHLVMDISVNFAQVVRAYTDRKPIQLVTERSFGCELDDSTCAGYLPGTGFRVNCTTTPFPYEVQIQPSSPGCDPRSPSCASTEPITVFETNVTYLVRTRYDQEGFAAPAKGFRVKASFKEAEDCVGTGVTRTCDFVPHLVRYKTRVNHRGEASLVGTYLDDQVGRKFYEKDVDIPDEDATTRYSTFGGFILAF